MKKIIFLLLAIAACFAPALIHAQEISEGVTLGVERGVELYWTVSTAPDDTWDSLAKRFLRGSVDAPALSAANRGGVLPGSIVKIPYSLLRYDEQRLTLLTLFPLDRNDGEDWLHVVGQAEKIPGESLSGVALWFTGRRELYRDIASDNGITNPGLAPGQQLRINQKLLLPAFLTPEALEAAMREAALHPPPPPPPPPESAPVSAPGPSSSPSSSPSPLSSTASTASAPGPVTVPTPIIFKADEIELPPQTPALHYGRDGKGEFAIYELRPHEALYSSVVIRFMGLVDAPEVNKQALLLAKQNGITDVTQIPAGFGIKLRAETLLPQYSPPGSAARIKYENRQRELIQVSSETAAPGPVPLLRSNRLKGVTVILDAGHGGPDPGAMHNGLWESDFVYDIFARVKDRLEKTTAAAVLAIVRDPSVDFKTRDEIPARTEKLEILTTPPFTPKKGDTKTAVNQRAKLISQLARAAEAGAASAPVVFTSFHADALHPSVRGTMIYVPDAELSTPARIRNARAAGRKKKKGKAEKAADEEPAPDVMSRSERIKAEAFSGRLASTLIRALRGEKIEVHPYDPVRSFVVRGGRPWVPAVIRDTPLRFKMLVEVCNLANEEDAKNLRDPKFRQSVAEAYVEALEKQFAPAKEKEKKK
jgi:N-acetylmuramoyl-L-alanine amidase